MKKVYSKRNLFFIMIVVLFMSLGSFGTIALANYTNVIVEASVVNVRLGPGLTYDIMTQIQGGTVVNVLSEKNEWYKVRMDDDRIGWVASWLINNTEVAASKNLIATVLDSSVNVREENNDQSEIVGSAVAGEKFDMLFEDNGWSQINYNNRVAWVLSSLIEISPGSIEGTTETVSSVEASENKEKPVPDENSIVISYDDVNVRLGPSLETDIVLTSNTGDTFTKVGKEGDFYEIEIDSQQTGFVASWLVADGTTEILSEGDSEKLLPSSTTLSEATIVIDPGHGGTDPGAEGSTFYEKEVTLQTAEVVAEKLRDAGANVILTRVGDEDVSLEERTYISSNYNADLFISLHYDSTAEGVYGTGITTYYYSDQTLPLAKLMNNKLAETLPLENNGSRFGDYMVLRENSQPSLLLELGYINNTNDVNIFNSDSYRFLVADSVYEALIEYFN